MRTFGSTGDHQASVESTTVGLAILTELGAKISQTILWASGADQHVRELESSLIQLPEWEPVRGYFRCSMSYRALILADRTY